MMEIGEKPLEIDLITIKHEEFRKLAMDQFFSRVMGDPALCVNKLESKLLEFWAEFQQSNKAASTEFCSTLLDHLYTRHVYDHIRDFTRASDLVSAWAKLRTDYREQVGYPFPALTRLGDWPCEARSFSHRLPSKSRR